MSRLDQSQRADAAHLHRLVELLAELVDEATREDGSTTWWPRADWSSWRDEVADVLVELGAGDDEAELLQHIETDDEGGDD